MGLIRLKYLGECPMRKGFAAAACLCVMAVAGAEPSPLSGPEISKLVAGATIEIDAPLGFKVRLRYTRDGQVSGETSTALVLILGAASDTGRWWVEPEQICHKWKVWFNDYPQCFRMTKEGQTYHWRTFDDKTGTATIVVPAPPVQTAAITQPSVPEAGVAKPTAPPERPRPVAKAIAPPEAAKQATEQRAQEKVPGIRAATPQAPLEAGIAKPTAPPERPRPVAKAIAPPEAAKQAAEQRRREKVPAIRAATPQAPKSQALNSPAGGVSRARIKSAPAAAEPAFRVVNVAPGDVLKVRKGPSTQFEVVGGLPPGSRGVTVTGACQSRWCPVEHPSARGWVNSTYLAREEPTGAGTEAPAGR
jgi:Bacterial SH3 domain